MAHRLGLSCLFALALGGGGCNAVLGIEEAHDRGSLMSTIKQAVPLKSCDAPRGECAADLAKGNAFANCLTTHDCRAALNDYRECLGSSCNHAGCLDAMKGGPADSVANWVKVESATCVDNSSLAGICDLYCACMEQPLPSGSSCAAFDGPDLPWAPLSGDSLANRVACKSHCMTLDLTSAHCRWSHCELANNGESASHCQHAVNEVNCPVKPKIECTDRRPGGWGCQMDEQCCSAACNNNFCAD